MSEGHFKKVLFVILVIGLLNSCSDDKPVSKSERAKDKIITEGDQTDEIKIDSPEVKKEDKTPEEVKPVSAKEAFLLTAYPTLVERCGGCHAKSNSPFFASEDKDKSFEEIFNNGKVNLLAPGKSQVVVKVYPSNHNCWDGDCEANGSELTKLIEDWAAKTTDGTIEALKKESEKNMTAPLKLADTEDKGIATLPDGTFAFEAEGAGDQNVVISGDFVEFENLKASYGKFMNSAENDGTIYADPDDAIAGTVAYTFNVAEAGTFRVYGLLNAPTEDDDSLFIKMDNGNSEIWSTGQTEESEFLWVQANTGNGAATAEYNLTAGEHTLQVRQREDGVGLDMLAVTNLEDFNGQRLVERVRVLNYDLSEHVGGEDVKFSIEITEFDEFSYKFKNPTIISANKNVKIKNLKIYVNGVFSPQNATYSLIDTTIEAPGGNPFSEATMIVGVDKSAAEDEFIFQFELLEIAE